MGGHPLGGSGQGSQVVSVSTHNFDMGSLYIEGDEWRVVGPTEAGPQAVGTGGKIAMWVSHDEGKHWEKRLQITAGSEFNHSHARRPLNGRDPFYTFWADGHANRLSESRLYFCDSTGKMVKQLPYQIDEELARPLDVR